MESNLNIQLPEELHQFVEERTHDENYSTPSEYVRDLIQKDMENRKKIHESEIASMLMAARNSPIIPLEDDFFIKERELLKERSFNRRNKD